MKHLLFCTRTVDGKEVCVSPLSIDAFEANHAYALGDDTGYFIYEFDAHRPSSGIEILAKAASYDAAVRLVDIYVMAAKQRHEETAMARVPEKDRASSGRRPHHRSA